MGNVKCVFCGVTRNRAKEHLWPVWLQQFLEGGSLLRTETHHAISGHAVSQRRLENGALVLGQVCEACNGGWMSQLEQRAAPILKALLAEPGALAKNIEISEATILATWAYKTAIVRNLGTNYRAIVPPAGSLPPGLFVDLAVDPAHQTLGAVQSQTASGMLANGDEAALEASKACFYNIVLGVGPLLFRVVHFPLLDYEVRTALAHGRTAFRLHPSANAGNVPEGCIVSGLYDFETATFFETRKDT
jgi:hypothetical protein